MENEQSEEEPEQPPSVIPSTVPTSQPPIEITKKSTGGQLYTELEMEKVEGASGLFAPGFRYRVPGKTDDSKQESGPEEEEDEDDDEKEEAATKKQFKF